MFAIYKREVKSYLCTVTGFLFMALVLLFVGLYYAILNGFNGYPDLSSSLSSGSMILAIGVPILTMRVFAEERRSRSDQLILTGPVSIGKIVLAKFLAMETLLGICMLVICLMPLLLRPYGEVQMAQSYTGILGFFLFASACIAIGEFVSATTDNIVIAAIGGIAMLFLGFMMTGITGAISSTGNLLTKILGAYDLTSHFSKMITGTFELAPVVYFVSLTALFLYFTVQLIQLRRVSATLHNFSVWGSSLLLTVIAVAVVVLLNVMVSSLPAKYTSFDLTGKKLYSLTEESKDFVAELQEDVKIYVLSHDQESLDLTLTNSLRGYESAGSHITVEYVDPVYSPLFYQKYAEEAPADGSVIVESLSSGRSKVIPADLLFEKQFNFSTYEYDITGYDGEGQITSAIAYVTGQEDNAVLMELSGHGETAMESSFVSAAEKMGLTWQQLELDENGAGIPEGTTLLLWNLPTSDITQKEKEILNAYVQGGGSIFFNGGYFTEELPNINAFLQENFGYSMKVGMVLESDTDRYYGQINCLIPELGDSRITESTREGGMVYAPLCGAYTGSGVGESQVLLSSSDSSYLRADLAGTQPVGKTAQDEDGPFTIGLYTGAGNGGGAVLYASGYLFTDSADMLVNGNNLQLFADSLRAILPADSAVFSIPVKSFETSYLVLTEGAAVGLFAVFVVILPLGLLVAGIVIWVMRRRRG